MTRHTRGRPESPSPAPDPNEPRAETVRVIEGWRAADLAAPASVPVEEVVSILNDAVRNGTVVRLECGGETLYTSGRIVRRGDER
ncbi:hypothetical protein [Microbacterium sp. H83]|uniref:hypothetical protein n=1 Tax=Microbacterium sp. H83 TaxID=1827324 RepID=UPI0007F4AA66|nr:hypothetical protein [Microbacterium sp. H83]OAN37439.1 hypothetical protein A4X16_16650 [Microbacterium sp. H83]